MKWASAISEQTAVESAIEECAGSLLGQLGGETPDFAVVFASSHYQQNYDAIPELVRHELGSDAGSPLVLGCSGGGIIGNGQEVEQRPALSITAASLPAVTVTPFHIASDALPDLDAGPSSWQELLKVSPSDSPQFVLLADPFSFPVQNLIMGMDFAFAGAAKIGGLASGGQQQGGNALFLGNRVHRSGAVGVALHGNITIDTVVAQGCRPIGQPMRITQSRQNMLESLDGETPLNVLRSLFPTLSERDQGLMRNSLVSWRSHG